MTGFPATRAEAWARWHRFLSDAPQYAQRRSFVRPGHPFVTRLSGAIRHRLVLERELIESLLATHAFATVDKLVQELCWRAYWKAWLQRRPNVWRDWVESVPRRRAALDATARRRLARLEAGDSGVAIMDAFARELVDTGYLHNHARMWFASFWVHVEELPWELGAEFFLRHLLDGDAASNTLSWRWIAGWHTAGKRYFVRRSNLERCLDPHLLESQRAGLERLEDARIAELEARRAPPTVTHPPPLPPEPPPQDTLAGLERLRAGVWLHDEDGCPELSPLAALRPAALLITGDALTAREWRYGAVRCAFAARALDDLAARAAVHYGDGLPCERSRIADELSVTEALERAVERHALAAVIALAPAVGPLADQLPLVRTRLEARGARLVLLRRPDDVASLEHAGAGYFSYWTRIAAALRAGAASA